MGGGVDAVVQLAEAIKVLRPTSHFPLLDVAIDPNLCDLAKTELVERWVSLAWQGLVLGVLGGPPCESWSDARWHSGGPPPGDASYPWGKTGLSSRHYSQLEVANALMVSTLELMMRITLAGGAGLMEHRESLIRTTWPQFGRH